MPLGSFDKTGMDTQSMRFSSFGPRRLCKMEENKTTTLTP